MQLPWQLALSRAAVGFPDYVLPDAITQTGQAVAVKSGAAATTVRAPARQLIDGSPTFTIAASSCAIFQARSGNWYVVAQYSTSVLPHAPTHYSGGSDPVDVKLLAGYPGGGTTFLRDDGTFAAPPSGSGNSASGTVDFGLSSQEETNAVVTVVAAWVLAASSIVCTVVKGLSGDHDDDDAMVEELVAYPQNIVAGVGFDIGVIAPNGTWGRYGVRAIGV